MDISLWPWWQKHPHACMIRSLYVSSSVQRLQIRAHVDTRVPPLSPSLGSEACTPEKAAGMAGLAEEEVKPGFYKIELMKSVWVLPNRYQDLQPLGSGAFGCVV